MDVGQWQTTGPLPPPPPGPPTLPPYGWVIPLQQAPPSLPAGLQPLAPAAPARRTHWLGWVAAALATFVFAVPVLLASPHGATPSSTGLRAVAGVSQQPWSAEFLDASGLPARWDPCTPIGYVVNYADAPAGAEADVEQAIARLSSASGLRFVSRGLSSERATRDRSAYQPEVYGNSWAPVLISWSPPAQTDLLRDPKSEAVTVPVAVVSKSRTGGGSLVSAEVVLNTDRQLAVGFGPGPSEGEVLMHELGHAVGLGHVASRDDAMYPSVRGIAAYGAGDLAGLAAVGRPAGCHPAPPPHPLRSLPAAVG
ncbi:MAG: hypothetical protein QOJ11_3819 [Frankiales bacterium]|nr:hypothetical protein [Frankiales bacterium]